MTQGVSSSTAGWVIADSQQQIGQISIGIDLVQLTGADQTLDDAHVLGTDLGQAEHPVRGRIIDGMPVIAIAYYSELVLGRTPAIGIEI